MRKGECAVAVWGRPLEGARKGLGDAVESAAAVERGCWCVRTLALALFIECWGLGTRDYANLPLTLSHRIHERGCLCRTRPSAIRPAWPDGLW